MNHFVAPTPVAPVPADAPKQSVRQRLEKELPREPGQIIRAINVFGDYYRVNWHWPLELNSRHPDRTGTIGKSRFLKAKVGPDNALIIEER